MSGGSLRTAGDVLFLAHRIPYPPNKGDKIRSFHELRHLAEAGWRVHLCALADDPEDLAHAATLGQWCVGVFIEPIRAATQKWKSLLGPLRGLPLSAPYFYSVALQRRVDSILADHPIDAILCFSGPMAEYVFRSARRSAVADRGDGRCPRLVMDLVDVDSEKWTQYAGRKNWPISWLYRLEGELLANYERRVARAFDATLLVSSEEARVFRGRVGTLGKVHAVGNGVDIEYFHQGPQRPGANGQAASSEAHRPARLVFCGAMDYYPNIDAVVWFAREVLPRVRERAGSVEFIVVGSKPTPEVKAIGQLPGVRVTGRVEDVRPYVWDAHVSVAPIRVARGIQNKVLEAMAMGKSVVSTFEAFEGIDAEPGADLLVAAAEPEAFATSVVELLKDPVRAGEVGVRARSVVERRYKWDAQLIALDGLLRGTGSVGECTAILEETGR